jgi:lipopolysaccharide transport system permease protein
MLYSLVVDRHLIAELTRRDIRTRYVGSVLGAAWAFLQPLALIFIFTVVFSALGRAEFVGAPFPERFRYSIYLCAGLLPWLLCADILQRGTTQFVDLANLIKKVAFRKPVLLWTVLFSSAVSFVIAFVIFLIFLRIVGPVTLAAVGAYLGFVALMALAALGSAAALACLNVYLRDTKQLVAIGSQLWFWATPIVWIDSDAMPRWIRAAERFNPLFWFVKPMQDLMVYQSMPTAGEWGLAVGAALLALIAGGWVLAAREGDLADEL